MPTREELTRGRVPELDGVRGLAIFLVVAWHYVFFPLQGGPGSSTPFAIRALQLSASGVDLFFVLSGFLIGGLLLDHRDSPRYFKTFYIRRFCRIVPPYFVWLALFFALLWAAPALVRSPVLAPLFDRPFPVWSYLTFTQNLLMARGETFGPDWLSVTWSLAVEEQFYVLLPLMVRFLPVRRLPYVFGFLVLTAPVHRVIADWRGGFGAMVLMPCRADALLLGTLCACLLRWERGRKIVAQSRWALYVVFVGSALVCLAAFGARIDRSPLVWSVVAVLHTALLLIAVTERRGPVSWLFRLPWLRYLGLLAYGVYLIHQAVNAVAHAAILGGRPGLGSMAEVAVTFAAFAATVGLAALSWHRLEKPMIQWGHSVRY